MDNQTIVVVSSILSLFGSLLILFLWISFRNLHFFSRKLICFLSAADALASVGFLLSAWTDGGDTDPHGTLCKVQGYIIQYAFLASYLWSGCFAAHLFFLICRRRLNPSKASLYYHIVAWGIPLAILLFVLFRTVPIGNASRPWCWIRTVGPTGEWSNEGAWMQLVCMCLPVTAVVLHNCFLYIYLARRVQGNAMGKSIRVRLGLYAIVMLTTSVWGVYNRFHQLNSSVHEAHPNSWTYKLECVFTPLAGLLNALVYGVNQRVIEAFKAMSCWPRSGPVQLTYEDDDTEDTLSYTDGLDNTPLHNSVDAAGLVNSEYSTSWDSQLVYDNEARDALLLRTED